MKRIFDNITGKYRDVEVNSARYNENGNDLYRIETVGKTGKVMYYNYYYINNGDEIPVYGSGGSTGKGWGGKILGYLTAKELFERNIKRSK